MDLILTLLAAAAVGYLLMKLRVPGGMMVGAAIGAAAYNIIIGGGQLPPFFKTAAQITVGAFIGSMAGRDDLRNMRRALKPGAVVILGMLFFNIVTGLIIHYTSSLDLLTAFLSVTPGGVSDMPILAADLGADASKVMVLQFIRFMTGIGIVPSVIGRVTKGGEPLACDVPPPGGKPGAGLVPVALTLAAATASGLLGQYSGMPAGTLAFSTIGTLLFKLAVPQARITPLLRKTAQCISGAYVGASIGMAQVREFILLPWPVTVLLVLMAVGTAFIGWALQRLRLLPLREGLLAATPSGASDMALISADLGVRNINVILIHVMRVIAVVTVFPVVLKLIADWLG